MKVLIVNWVYNWGSTGYILRDIKNSLEHSGHQVFTACGINRGEKCDGVFEFSSSKEMSFYRRLMRIGWPKFKGSYLGYKKLVKYINQTRPDVVHIHLLHCGCIDLYRLFEYLGKNKIKTVITHHAELYYTGSCSYSYDCNGFIENQCLNCKSKWWATGSYLCCNPNKLWKKMHKAFSWFNPDDTISTSVSPWVKSRLEKSSITKHIPCEVVMNGIDVDIFKPTSPSLVLKERLNNIMDNYVVYISAKFDPINKNDIKGGYYLVEVAKVLKDVNFVVVATENINTESLPSNVFLWGKAKSQTELAELYSNAKVTVLTSKKETFSMICAESLCCGTPIVGFKSGGPETIALSNYSTFVDYGNIQSLAKSVKETTSKVLDKKTISAEAINRYSKEIMTQNYIEVYKKILSK